MRAGIIAFAAALCIASGAGAQDPVADFYRGKTVRITVGSAAGGGFDGYARLVARHFGKHIPGNPTVVVQNIPGSGSNKAASYVALQAPKDGTAIGAIQPSAVLHKLQSDQTLPHDPQKFIMLGSAASGVYLCLVNADAPVKSFAETFTKEVLIGTPGEGASLRIMPVLLVNVLDVKLRLIGGYAGSNEILLAMDRKEVHGMCGMSWSSISMQRGASIKDGSLRAIVQEDLQGHPDLNKQGVPLATSFAKTTEQRQVMEAIYSQNMFGRPYVLPEGVPPDRVAALRKAFIETMNDPALVAEADKAGMELGARDGEEVQTLVNKLYALPASVVERTKKAMIYKPK
ncbi:MAG TPA: tripartite tricarboxylate transporter substrate-binding protein [Xanthobacteraceae bacterium]|nr:tripartite tricarboxylate transporter substrate-binding protein [Xanthobacteraceae bacterium]